MQFPYLLLTPQEAKHWRKKNQVSRNLLIVQMGNTYTYKSMYIQMVESEKWLKVI
jgi:hypothetical protein